MTIEIFTDGSCLGNPGPGGWAAIVIQNDKELELKGKAKETTSNRMELTSALEGLSRVPENSQVNLYSDSKYLVKTMTEGWKRRANLDLWQRLDELVSTRKVQWIWVKGHSGNINNERVNKLAMEMCTSQEEASHRESAPAHFNSRGEVHMVDISGKEVTEREAVAKGRVKMKPSTLEAVERGEIAKGEVLTVAKTAGIMAAKRTWELIPLCHPVWIDNISVELELDKEGSSVEIRSTARAKERTGLEMEALTATAVSALTIYDMCKVIDKGIRIEGIRLVRKSGGKSGDMLLE